MFQRRTGRLSGGGDTLEKLMPGYRDKIWARVPDEWKLRIIQRNNKAFEDGISKHKNFQSKFITYKAVEDKFVPDQRFRKISVDWRRQLARGTLHIGRWFEGPNNSDYRPGKTFSRLDNLVPFSAEEWQQRKEYRVWDGVKHHPCGVVVGISSYVKDVREDGCVLCANNTVVVNFLPMEEEIHGKESGIDNSDSRQIQSLPASTSLPQESQQIYMYNYAFNQDNTCFSLATTADFRTFLLSPNVMEVSRRRISVTPSTSLLQNAPSPTNVAAMLFQTNYLALVARESPYKVLLWDDSLAQPPHDVWSRFEVLNVLMRRDVFCVVSEYKIYVYEFGSEFRVLLHLETAGNPKGVCALSPGGNDWVMVCPGSTKGSVRIQIGLDDSISSNVVAHANSVACVAVNLTGTMAASASEQGTVIKVYNTADGSVLHELRRGTVSAQISSIVFRKDNKFLVVGSASPTVHIFRLEASASTSTNVSRSSSSVVIGKMVEWASSADSQSTKVSVPKYFQSSRSYATFRIPDTGGSAMDLRFVGSPVCGPIVTFANHQPNKVLVVHYNGLLYDVQFDEARPESGQECTFLGATAYFQPRPDFSVGARSTIAPAGADGEPANREDNWELI